MVGCAVAGFLETPAIVQTFLIDPVLAAAILVYVMCLAWILVTACEKAGGTFASAVRPQSTKLSSLEGLRGLLALSVVAHHAYCWYYFTQSGIWETGGSILFERLASFGVMQFFFISGFLFWRKLMKHGSIDLGSFYLSRFVRLAPVYYVCVGSALVIVLSLSNFTIMVSIGEFSRSLVSWILFSLGGQPDVNGQSLHWVVAGVVWTLGMEWCFYLSLPFLGWFSRKAIRLVHLALLSVIVFAVCKYFSSGRIHIEVVNLILLEIREFAKFMLIGFGGGILIATFIDKVSQHLQVPRFSRNWLLLALYGFYLLVPHFPGFEYLSWIVLLCAFGLVVQGTDLFGMLTSKAVRFLGLISYSLYLVHGIVYYVAMRLRGGMHAIMPSSYISQTSLTLAAIILIATAIHFLVERPSMLLSERISRAGSSGPRQPRGVSEPTRIVS